MTFFSQWNQTLQRLMYRSNLRTVETYTADILCSLQEFKSISLDHYGGRHVSFVN
jgi:hypothetical protein